MVLCLLTGELLFGSECWGHSVSNILIPLHWSLKRVIPSDGRKQSPEMPLPFCPAHSLLLPGQGPWPAFLCSNSLCPTHHTHTHRTLVPGIQAAAWSHCWKWPPNRCAFNLFPGHWPLCPKEAASQAGGPKIAVYVCPWMGLSITARPLPPDASLWWLHLAERREARSVPSGYGPSKGQL